MTLVLVSNIKSKPLSSPGHSQSDVIVHSALDNVISMEIGAYRDGHYDSARNQEYSL